MTIYNVTFPKNLPSPLPEDIQDAEIKSQIPPMSWRAKAVCGGTLLAGAAAIAWFATSIACHLAPGMTIFSVASGMALIGAATVGYHCSTTMSTARKINIYDYLIKPENQEAIRKQIKEHKHAIRQLMRANAMRRDKPIAQKNLFELRVPLKGIKGTFLIVPNSDIKEEMKPLPKEEMRRQSVTGNLLAILESRRKTK